MDYFSSSIKMIVWFFIFKKNMVKLLICVCVCVWNQSGYLELKPVMLCFFFLIYNIEFDLVEVLSIFVTVSVKDVIL